MIYNVNREIGLEKAWKGKWFCSFKENYRDMKHSSYSGISSRNYEDILLAAIYDIQPRVKKKNAMNC